MLLGRNAAGPQLRQAGHHSTNVYFVKGLCRIRSVSTLAGALGRRQAPRLRKGGLPGQVSWRRSRARQTYSEGASIVGHVVVSTLATIFGLLLLYAAGVKFMLFSAIIDALGTAVYVIARRENGQRAFSGIEAAVYVLLILPGMAGVVGLATGRLSI